jgi:hypothetical protein
MELASPAFEHHQPFLKDIHVTEKISLLPYRLVIFLQELKV